MTWRAVCDKPYTEGAGTRASASASNGDGPSAGSGDGPSGSGSGRPKRVRAPPGRGLHSSTFRLNVSASCGIGGAIRG